LKRVHPAINGWLGNKSVGQISCYRKASDRVISAQEIDQQ
jgi:hypothetical protein